MTMFSQDIEKAISAAILGHNYRECAEISGLSYSYCYSLLSGRHEDTSVYEELQRRKQELGEAAAEETKWSLARLLQEYENVYQGAFMSRQFGVASKTLDSIFKACGYDVKRHEISGKDGAPLVPAPKYDWSKLPQEEKMATIKALQAARVDDGTG